MIKLMQFILGIGAIVSLAVSSGSAHSQPSVVHADTGTSEQYQILFTSNSHPLGPPDTDKIYVLSLDGSHLRRLTYTGRFEHEYGPAWSPSGEQIAFVAMLFSEQASDGTWIPLQDLWDPDIYLVHYGQKGSISQLTHDDDIWSVVSTWSPKGLLTFSTESIFVLNPALPNPTPTKLTDGFSGRWSPDGTQVAFLRRSSDQGAVGLWVINADGSRETKLLSHSASISVPQWSPDGKRLVFAQENEANWDIYLINADGSNLIQVTDTPVDDSGPTWSPDGEMIAFYNRTINHTTLHIVRSNGSRQVEMPVDPRLAIEHIQWVPDMSGIVFYIDDPLLVDTAIFRGVLYFLDGRCIEAEQGCSFKDARRIPNSETGFSYFEISPVKLPSE